MPSKNTVEFGTLSKHGIWGDSLAQLILIFISEIRAYEWDGDPRISQILFNVTLSWVGFSVWK